MRGRSRIRGAVCGRGSESGAGLFRGSRKSASLPAGICKRLAHLGIKTHYVGEITEPAITEHDLLVVGSGSGGSLFPLGIAKKAHSIGAKIVHIGSNPHSEMKDLCEFMVRIPVRTKNYLEDEIDSIQPMTSLFEQSLLFFGDVVAKMIIDERGLDMKSLWRYHANLE